MKEYFLIKKSHLVPRLENCTCVKTYRQVLRGPGAFQEKGQ